MKLQPIVFSALLFLGGTAFASGTHECKCDHECHEACTKGDKTKCECKECGCKDGKCDHAKKCDHAEHKKDAKKK